MFFRRRQSSGSSIFFLFFGGFGLLFSCAVLGFGVPAAFSQARTVRSLPQLDSGEVRSQTAGSRAIFRASIPDDVPIEEGLALFYIEERYSGPSDEDDSTSSNWERTGRRTAEIDMEINSEEVVNVIVSNGTSFLQAEQVTFTIDDGDYERRYVGYLRNQTLTVDGIFEANGSVTAEAFYRGAPAEYVESVGRRPFQTAIFGGICMAIATILLGIGVVTRFLRR